MHKVKLAAITCELPARSYENDDPVFAAVPDLSESWWQFWGVNRRGYFDPRNGGERVQPGGPGRRAPAAQQRYCAG